MEAPESGNLKQVEGVVVIPGRSVAKAGGLGSSGDERGADAREEPGRTRLPPQGRPYLHGCKNCEACEKIDAGDCEPIVADGMGSDRDRLEPGKQCQGVGPSRGAPQSGDPEQHSQAGGSDSRLDHPPQGPEDGCRSYAAKPMKEDSRACRDGASKKRRNERPRRRFGVMLTGGAGQAAGEVRRRRRESEIGDGCRGFCGIHGTGHRAMLPSLRGIGGRA
jgi:hypothetical protein